ncbi:b(0,+)-type amino acid transporter 1-like [Pomacea canaliculata]|uniref:b(0,+)-type amino acid transporter 1-like n=1 Tax=Pomacea canaliculata TaxID=400727 RepID=UPI000D73DAF3|nr:b(0,+)-type amino acid transporter 1-like [Pomacea canaliculata]XP_025115962.1 b(0,+)-type amino acid transporter 1-like [Pomacea canaliculata]XP_025115963.1 b(0,+)-type amino acid transporter 1-like [Pomacea canaliculata]
MIAISGLAFADYLLTLAPVCGPRPELIVKLCAVAMIVTLMVINCKSNDVAAPVQVICTILKILALLVIVFGGIIRMAQGWTAELRQGFDNSTKESVNIALAFYSINYSYAGWSNVFTIFEEVKNPKRNLLACSGVGILVVTVLYIMANISFLTVLSRKEMMTSSAVAVDWADVVLGSASITMLLAIAVSTFGAAASSLFTGSRIIFAAGRDNVMPEWLSFLHVNNLSPVPAILFTGILAIIFVIPGGIGNIINFLMFPMNILDFLSTTVLFVFRKTKPNAPRIIKVPLLVPCLVLAYTLFLLVTPLVLNPRMEFLYATCFVVAGVLFYVPFIHCGFRINRLDGAVAKLQLLLQVSPATYSKLQ